MIASMCHFIHLHVKLVYFFFYLPRFFVLWVQRIPNLCEKRVAFCPLIVIPAFPLADIAPVPALEHKTRTSPVVASCLRFIRRNISQPVTLKNVAAHAGISPGYLSTVFKKEIGLSVSDYIAVQRIEEAKRLLDTTDQTLSEISAYLCFSSQSYFQNVFKKITGMTPMEYKKINLK